MMIIAPSFGGFMLILIVGVKTIQINCPQHHQLYDNVCSHSHIRNICSTNRFYSIHSHLDSLSLSHLSLLKLCCKQTICKKNQERSPGDEQQPNQDNEDEAPLIVPVTTVPLSDFVADDLFADRMLNPDEYNED